MDQVSEIRNKTDIVSLIQSYVPLKRMGNNFKTNCPFHGEKTPSFVVSPERQIWHCFGCGKGGDCFSFLMEYEHMEFPEALRILADRAGVHLVQTGFDSAESSKKETIYKLNSLASEFYHFLLTKHKAGEQALLYVQGRGIKPKTIETYMIGFAPSSGVALVNYLLQKKKYKPADVLEAGLATSRGGRLVDFFQNRLMFPLYDHRNNIIGFSGRILISNENTSKYINTRETLVYHKGNVFFGLNSSKEAIKKENKAIVMEGELDVIAAFQEGVTNTVAIKGTALTVEQVNLIARFAKNVALCFDSDNAGQEAMKRSLPTIEKKGLTTTVIIIPNGKDPDEAIKTDAVAFKKAVKHDVPVYDVLLEQSLKKYDVNSASGKKQIGDELLPHLGLIGNEIVKEHYMRLLAKAIDTSYDVLVKEQERLAKREIVKEEVTLLRPNARSREEVLEEYLLSLLVQYPSPSILLAPLTDFQQDYVWETPAFGKIVSHLSSFSMHTKEFSSKLFLETLPQELVSAFDKCFLLPLPSFGNDEAYVHEVQKTAEELSVLGLKRQIKTLTGQMKKLEQEENEAEIALLNEKLSPLLEKLSGYKSQ